MKPSAPIFSTFLERYHQATDSQKDPQLHASPSCSIPSTQRVAIADPDIVQKHDEAPPSPNVAAIWPKWPAYRTWEALHQDTALHTWVAAHYADPIRTRYLKVLQSATPPAGPYRGGSNIYYRVRYADTLYRWSTHPHATPWHAALEDALSALRDHALLTQWAQRRYTQNTAQQISRCWTDAILRVHPDPHPDFETLESTLEQKTPETFHPAPCDLQPLSDMPDHPDPPSNAAHTADDSETPQDMLTEETLTSVVPPSADAQPPEDQHRSSQSDELPLAQWIQTWDHLEAYHDTAAWLDRLSTLIQQLDPTCQPLSVLQAWIPEAFPKHDTLHALLQLIELAYPPSVSR